MDANLQRMHSENTLSHSCLCYIMYFLPFLIWTIIWNFIDGNALTQPNFYFIFSVMFLSLPPTSFKWGAKHTYSHVGQELSIPLQDKKVDQKHYPTKNCDVPYLRTLWHLCNTHLLGHQLPITAQHLCFCLVQVVTLSHPQPLSTCHRAHTPLRIFCHSTLHYKHTFI